MFLAVSNLISFIPLPVSHESGTFPFGIPDLSLYAATANINVTLALTLITFVAFNYEGVRAHGPVGYIKTLVPDAPRRSSRSSSPSSSCRRSCAWSASPCVCSPTCWPATC